MLMNKNQFIKQSSIGPAGFDNKQNQWIKSQFNKLPDMLADSVADIAGQKLKAGLSESNIFVSDTVEHARNVPFSLALSDDEIVSWAKAKAISAGRQKHKGRKWLENYCYFSRIEPPSEDKEDKPAILRMTDELWWRRKARHMIGKAMETAAIQAGLVRKGKQIYISDVSIKQMRDQKQRTDDVMSKYEYVNEDGEAFDMNQIMALSVSNPRIRRAELMERISGFEYISTCYEHTPAFVTITCPSRMHRMKLIEVAKDKEGKPIYKAIDNKKWDGETFPKQAHEYMCNQWNKSRAMLDREGIRYYGMRVAEPHHDGTPHWHMLFFVEPENKQRLIEILRHYAYEMNPEELKTAKAKGARFDVKDIDPSKGTATGYIAKYISKSIDGYGIEKDLYGTDAKSAAERVTAWARRWKIRQFQQMGGPDVGTWRHARKLAKENVNDNKTMSAIWYAADSGDWAAYVQAMGGPFIKRKDKKASIYKELIQNKYAEAIKVPQGIQCQGRTYSTKIHTWTLVRKLDESNIGRNAENIEENAKERSANRYTDNGAGVLPELSESIEGSGRNSAGSSEQDRRDSNRRNGSGFLDFEFGSASRSPWSSVNNCTQPKEHVSGYTAESESNRAYERPFSRGSGVENYPDVTKSRESRKSIEQDYNAIGYPGGKYAGGYH